MRRTIVTLLLATMLPAARVQTCGDKFLLVGGGALFPKGYRAAHPAAVLLYLPNAAGQANAGKDILSVLRKAGHTATVVTSEKSLEDAFTQRVDVVVGSVAAIAAVESRRTADGRAIVLLPVLPNPTREELAAATKRYQFVVNGRDPVNLFLHAIDDAMEFRAGTGGPSR